MNLSGNEGRGGGWEGVRIIRMSSYDLLTRFLAQLRDNVAKDVNIANDIIMMAKYLSC